MRSKSGQVILTLILMILSFQDLDRFLKFKMVKKIAHHVAKIFQKQKLYIFAIFVVIVPVINVCTKLETLDYKKASYARFVIINL